MNTRRFDPTRAILTTARFLTFFSLAIWLGGLIFFGAMAIPAAISLDRALVPLMVGAMLNRFTPVLYICGALLFLGWMMEKSIRGAIHSGNRKLWLAQGVCSGLMLAIALVLGLVLMPSLQTVQRSPDIDATRRATAQSTALETRKAIVIRLPPPVASAAKARFDAQHKLYTQLSMLSVWLGLATLALLCARLSLVLPPHEYSYAGETVARDIENAPV